jgi:hypothetical protein
MLLNMLLCRVRRDVVGRVVGLGLVSSWRPAFDLHNAARHRNYPDTQRVGRTAGMACPASCQLSSPAWAGLFLAPPICRNDPAPRRESAKNWPKRHAIRTSNKQMLDIAAKWRTMAAYEEKYRAVGRNDSLPFGLEATAGRHARRYLPLLSPAKRGSFLVVGGRPEFPLGTFRSKSIVIERSGAESVLGADPWGERQPHVPPQPLT